MNTTTDPRAQPHTPSLWSQLAWLPIPLLIAAIVVLKALDWQTAHESEILMMLFNFAFSTLASLLVVVLFGRNVLTRGTPGMLLFGCGVLLWGAAGTVVPVLLTHGINVMISVHNILVCLSAFFQLAGAILLLKPRTPFREAGPPLAVAYVATLGVVWLVTVLVLESRLPVFFVQGEGGTPLRYVVLASATMMFAGAAALLWTINRRIPTAFVRWYGPALLLVATGLFGIMIESVHGGALSWTGRTAQFLGGAYMLVAALASVRESGSWKVTVSEALEHAREAVRTSEERYRTLFAAMTEGFALHEIITDDSGRPCDYRFLEVNPAFERLTGLKRVDLIGKCVREVMPGTESHWIENYGKVALTGEALHMENYSAALKRWFDVYAYRTEQGRFAVVFNDITERKRAEVSHQIALNRFNMVLSHMPLGVLLIGGDGWVEFSNQTFCDIFNLKESPADLEGLASGELIERIRTSYSEPEKAVARIMEVVAQGQPVKNEDIPMCDGKTVLRDFVPLHVSGAQYSRLWIHRDITERKRSGEALRESEERLKLVLQASSTGTFEVDLMTGAGRWNATEYELLGLKPGEIPPGPEAFFRYVHPDDVGLLQAHWEEALHVGKLDSEFRIVRPDEEVRWLAGKGEFVFESKMQAETPKARGQALSFMGVNYDITERKQAEECLRRSEEQLRRAQEIAHLGSWDLDLIENRLTWSDEVYRIFGLQPQEFIATYEAFLERVHPDDRVKVDEAYSGSLRENRDTYEIEHRIVRKDDGKIRIVHERCQHFRDATGKIVRSGGMVHDITERKSTEEALRLTQESIDCAAEMVAWFTPDGRVHYVNDATCRTLGYSRDELLQMTALDFSPGFTWEQYREHWQEVRERKSFSLETTHRRKDGSDYPAEVLVNYILYGGQEYIFAYGRDITERKRDEEALRESEQLFRVLIKNLQSAVALVNESGAFMIVNRAFLCMFNLADDSNVKNVNDHDWSQWQVFDEQGTLLNVDEHPVRKTALTGKPVRDQLVAVKAPENPELKWMLVSAEPILDAQGRIHRLICTYHDITVRKQAEEALRRQSEAALNLSEQEFSSLAEAMPQIVWATRPDGWNIYFNQQWVDYTGLTMEESNGHGWNTPFHPDDKPRAWDAWQRATQYNERYSLECRLRRADGVYRWWLIRGEPMRGANGEILKWFGTCTDIEEIKHAETLLHEANALLEQRVAERTAALRESEALYRGIGESIDYGVWACAPDGRNTYASKSFLNMVGITQEQCSNFGWGDVLHPDDAERTIAAWQECVRTGGKWDIEHRFRGTDGQWHHVLARGVPVRNDQDEIISWAGINLDISRLKQAEEQIKQSLTEKEVMLKEIHHRVKNNLQIISSLVNLQANGSKDETVREVLKDVTYRVRSMALVHEKLYQSADLARVDFAEYARSLLGYLWRAHGATAASVRLMLDLQQVSLPVDTAVPCGLILNELAGNALKHAFQGRTVGEVTVSLQNLEDGGIRLRVQDNGVGLPDEFVWHQTPSLGLRLVQMLSKQIGAGVEVRGEDGTRFEIVFQCPRSI